MITYGEKFYIGTTRFNNLTYNENVEWRRKHQWVGCIYGCNKKMPRCVPHMSLIFVLEMNNDTNKIMGIGLIRNYINLKYKVCIYKSDTNYNRYIYNSSVRIEREDIPEKMLEMLETIVFTGYGHYKRGQGITTIAWSKFGDQIKQIYEMFYSLISKQ